MNYLLLIEDREGQVAHIRDALNQIDDLTVVVAANLEEYKTRIAQREWDAVIADLQVPKKPGEIADLASGKELLKDLWPRVPKEKILVLTVHLDLEEVRSYLKGLELFNRAYQKMPSEKRLAELVRTMLAA